MTGVLLIAFGRRGYGLAAHNLALSLRAYAPDLNIILYASDNLQGTFDPSLFTAIYRLKDSDYLHPTSGKIDPARAKCQAYALGIKAGLDRFLFLDVDAIALSDIRPTLDALKGCTAATYAVPMGQRSAAAWWAKPEVMYRHFDLLPDAPICGVQSSWMYFERGKVCDLMQQMLSYYFAQGRPVGGMSLEWGKGGMLPDEFVYQGVFAKMGIVPTPPLLPRQMVFFGNNKATETPDQVAERYNIIAIYGTKSLTLPKWLRMYDRHMAAIGGHWHGSDQIMKDKFANF